MGSVMKPRRSLHCGTPQCGRQFLFPSFPLDKLAFFSIGRVDFEEVFLSAEWRSPPSDTPNTFFTGKGLLLPCLTFSPLCGRFAASEEAWSIPGAKTLSRTVPFRPSPLCALSPSPLLVPAQMSCQTDSSLPPPAAPFPFLGLFSLDPVETLSTRLVLAAHRVFLIVRESVPLRETVAGLPLRADLSMVVCPLENT